MKLIDILKEIGEGSKEPYPYKRTSGDPKNAYAISEFRWSTEEGVTYELMLHKYENHRGSEKFAYIVDFGIVNPDGRIDFKSTSKNTKTGNLYRTMATVVDIVKKEIELDKQEFYRSLDRIVFSPTKEDESDNRRLKLYAAYIKKQMPEAEIVSTHGTIIVNL